MSSTAIDVMNSLIQINNDRIEGYRTAFDETLQDDLKVLFSRFINTSKECKSELMQEVEKLGGTPAEGADAASKFFRLWMDIKYTLTCNDRNTVLKSCEKGEKVAVDAYTDAIDSNYQQLTMEQQKIIKAQLARIKSDQEKIQYLHSKALED